MREYMDLISGKLDEVGDIIVKLENDQYASIIQSLNEDESQEDDELRGQILTFYPELSRLFKKNDDPEHNSYTTAKALAFQSIQNLSSYVVQLCDSPEKTSEIEVGMVREAHKLNYGLDTLYNFEKRVLSIYSALQTGEPISDDLKIKAYKEIFPSKQSALEKIDEKLVLFENHISQLKQNPDSLQEKERVMLEKESVGDICLVVKEFYTRKIDAIYSVN